MKRALSLGIGLCLLGGAALADPTRGLELFEQGRFDEAAQELTAPAKAGDPASQYVLGVMYLNQMVEPPDETEAVRLITAAANSGYLQAQSELARMYRDGVGVAQDHEKMMQWYRKAAERGDVGAQLFLADGYGYGYGVEPDLVEAYKWYEIAIRYWGPLAVRARDILAERMTEEQIAEGVRRAAAWKPDSPAE